MRVVLTSDVPHYFKCTQCGLCCKGSVELTQEEYEKITKIASQLGIRIPIEIRDYIFQTKIIMRPVEDDKGEKWCIFLDRRGDKALCTIYEHRPSFCRLYPLYIGVSRELDTIFVDVVHCPHVRHVPQDDYARLDETYVSKVIDDIVSQNPSVLNIVPDLDRHCIILDLGDRVVACKLYRKYEIERKIVDNIVNLIDPDCTWLDVFRIILAFQMCIRDISSRLMFRTGLPAASELAKEVEDCVKDVQVNLSKIADREVVQQAKLILQDVGVRIDESMYYVYDVVHLKSKLYRLEDEDFRLRIGDMTMYVKEMLYRFPVYHQLHFLPLEMTLTHGYFPLVAMTMLYSVSLRDQDVWDRIANVDMSALPYVFKYVSTLVRLTYASRLREQWHVLPEG